MYYTYTAYISTQAWPFALGKLIFKSLPKAMVVDHEPLMGIRNGGKIGKWALSKFRIIFVLVLFIVTKLLYSGKRHKNSKNSDQYFNKIKPRLQCHYSSSDRCAGFPWSPGQMRNSRIALQHKAVRWVKYW